MHTKKEKEMIELEIVRRQTMKPLPSTPHELRNLPLGLFDQQVPPNMYIQLLYYFHNNVAISDGPQRRRVLKDSFAKSLTFYYPFAGRLRDDGNSVDCNDAGATFSEAKLPYPMSEFMNDFNVQCKGMILKSICLDDTNGNDPKVNPLLSIQLTQFQCGGEVICVFLAHKVADMASLTNFMNDWAAIARSFGDGDVPVVRPQFNASEFFPPELNGGDHPSGGGEGEGEGGDDHEIVSSKRLVFEGSKIEALKAMICEKVENPTRVQILTSLIYKAVVSANKLVKGGQPTTNLVQVINLRTRVEPPLPAAFIGNIVSSFIASSTTSEQKEIELWKLVDDMKRKFEEFCEKFPKKYGEKEWNCLHKLFTKESMERWRNPSLQDHSIYICTSWCKFRLYDTDFGWGKPVWITAPVLPGKNVILLMDGKHGEGIEAILSLEKEEMAAFEQNEELLSFCELKLQ